MSMTRKQKERAVRKAVKKMDEAADCMCDLVAIAHEHGVKDTALEGRFISELRERAGYWDRCTWWKK